MALYDEMQQIARDILSNPDFKQGSTSVVKVTPGTGPIDEPGEPTLTVVPVDGAVRGAKFRYVASGLAVKTDLQITFAVVPGMVPAMTDFVQVDGVRYKIKGIDPKPAGGVPVVYTVIFGK